MIDPILIWTFGILLLVVIVLAIWASELVE
jgi:hypothetical protein